MLIGFLFTHSESVGIYTVYAIQDLLDQGFILSSVNPAKWQRSDNWVFYTNN